MIKEIITIATDGCCKSSMAWMGGWAAIYSMKDITKVLYGFEPNTTNQRMELMAAIRGLEHLKVKPCKIILISDSAYLVNGKMWWMNKWLNRDFEGVKNKDLWLRLNAAANGHMIQWKHVRGHNGHKLNELADHYANVAVKLKLNLQDTITVGDSTHE